jgi:hypothetical protein
MATKHVAPWRSGHVSFGAFLKSHRSRFVGGGFPFRQPLRLNRILAQIQLASRITG